MDAAARCTTRAKCDGRPRVDTHGHRGGVLGVAFVDWVCVSNCTLGPGTSPAALQTDLSFTIHAHSTCTLCCRRRARPRDVRATTCTRIARSDKEERRALEAERKALIARSRAEVAEKKAKKVAERIARAVASGASHRSRKKKGKQTPVAPAMGEALVHAAWDSPEEREARTEAFEAKQAAEHAEKLARVARTVADAKWAQATEASKNREALMHVVPTAPSLDAFVSQLAIE